MMSHDWRLKSHYGYVTVYKCTQCDCAKYYSWCPGWSGVMTYCDADEQDLGGQEPPCEGTPTVPATVVLGED